MFKQANENADKLKTKLKILHLEDTPADAELVERELRIGKIHFEKLVVGTKTAFEKALKEFAPDLIIADHTLPSFDSMEALKIIKQQAKNIPFILVTSTVSDEHAIAIMKEGADDYILKDRLHRLPQAVINAMEKFSLEIAKQAIIDQLIISELHSKEAQAVAKLGSWETDLQTYIVKWSDEIHHIFETDPKTFKVTHDAFLNYTHPDDRTKVNTAFENSFNTQTINSIEHRIIATNGEVKYILENWKIFQDEKGLPVRALGTCQDITERKRAEEALHESESNLQAIFENTSEGFILANPNGIVKSFNTKSAQTIFLNTEKEIKIGSNIYDFIHPSRKESYKGVLSKVLAGETMQYDYSFERKNGDTKWFSFIISPVYNQTKTGEIEGVCITSADITQRKKGDEENSLLVSIINSTDDAIITKNLDGIITSWNQGAEKTFGYPANEIIGKPLSILFPSNLKDQESKILKKIKKGESVEHYETERVRKDGKIINVSLTISPIKDSLGNIVGASKISRDITRRKKAEEERNMFFDLSIDMMGITGNDGHFHRVNPSFEKTLGFTPAELYAKPFLEFVHPDDVSSTLLEVEKLAKGAPCISFTNRYSCKDGNYKWLEWSAQPVGKTLYCIARDITERKEAESRLQESENRFRSLIENSADMLTMLSPTGKTIYASPAVAKNFGYTNEEMLNLNMADIVHPDDALIVQDFVMKVMNHPGLAMPCPLIRNIKKDGTYMWLEGTLTNFLETEGINAIVANFRDVTEYKSAEEQKKAAEFKYRQIVETAQEGIWMLDENNLTTFANNKLGEILEYSPEEMMGKENFFFMDDSGKKLSLEALERRRKGIKENMDLPYITKSGKQIWTSVSASPLFDETGKYKGALGMVADITLRKEAERKLLESESFNKGVLSSLSSHIAVIAENGILIAVNKAWDDFARSNGVTSLERVSTGSNYFDVCKRATENGDKDAAQALAGIQSVFKKETQKFEMEYPCHAPEQQRWFILSAMLFGSDAQKVVISHQDITIQKLGEQSLHQSQSNLQAIIENTDASIYSLDTELRYIAFNKLLHDTMDQLYGIDIKIGDHVYSFLEKLDTEEANGWEKLYSRALSGENVEFEREFSIGDYHNYSSFTIYPIWENKTIIGLSCFVFDITQQTQEQQQKEKLTADLIQRNRDLEQFTFIVSHNLRAPTANIIGFAELLQDETRTPQDQKEILQELSTSVTGLDTIIKDINTLLQIKREINEKKEIVIFSKLVNDIMISVGNLIDKDLVRIKTDFSQVDEFCSLKAYIYSIFYNLIINSIKYSKPNGQSLIEITSKKENGKLILTFKDNGLGMDLKAKGDKVFGLYKRFHSHVEGKGMGLFMVKTQVESLGGSITIKSEPNIGTEFTIVFENTSKGI